MHGSAWPAVRRWARRSPPREERKVVTVSSPTSSASPARAEPLDPEDVRAHAPPYHARLRARARALRRHGREVHRRRRHGASSARRSRTRTTPSAPSAPRSRSAMRPGAERGRAGLDLHVRIGITTGEALVALDARPGAGEGMVAGDVVNTAARLQAAAPVDGILVGETTYRATERAIEYRGGRPVDRQGQGRAGPRLAGGRGARSVRHRRPARRRDAAGRPAATSSTCCWRRSRAARAERTPSSSRSSASRASASAVSSSELFRARRSGSELITWRQGRSLPYGEGIAFWALAEMVKAQAGSSRPTRRRRPARSSRAAIEDFLDEPASARWVEAHLRPLVGIAGERRPGRQRRGGGLRRLAALPRGTRRARPARARLRGSPLGRRRPARLRRLPRRLGGRASRSSSSARRGPSCSSAGPAGVEESANAHTVSLAPRLTDEETARLLPRCSSGPSSRPSLQTTLLERAGGNPLYAEEFARMLEERGADHGELPLPESLQGLVAARLDGAPAEEKALVQDAAVIGKVFWGGALAALAERPRWRSMRRSTCSNARSSFAASGDPRSAARPSTRSCTSGPRRRLRPDPSCSAG